MTSSVVTDYRAELSKALEDALDEDDIKRLRKKIDDALTECEDYMLASLKDTLADNLAGHVHECFRRAFEAMVNGNESEFRRWIHAEGYGFTGRDRKHSVIHGRLFEAEPIKLRRMLAEANAEVIRDERVKDLEDQVTSLVEQVNDLERRNNALRDELNNYRPRG